MNQDFFVEATPAFARKLLKLSAITPIDLDPYIIKLAKQDLITQEQFDSLPFSMTENERMATQSFLDHDMRAIMIADEGIRPITYRKVIFAAALFRNIKKITMLVMHDKEIWSTFAKSLGFETSIFVAYDPDVLMIQSESMFPSPEICTEERRRGLFISDRGPFDGSATNNAAAEWQHIAIAPYLTQNMFGNKNNTSWYKRDVVSAQSAVLHPNMPSRLLINNTISRKTYLTSRGFHGSHPSDIAFLYNIISDMVDMQD